MNNAEKDGGVRNINAEWATLKETAMGGVFTLGPEKTSEKADRERYRRRGEMLLRIVNEMPARMDDNLKEEKLDRIYHAAERAGIKESLDYALNYEQRYSFNQAIGEETLGENKELSKEEQQTVERLREKVFDLTEMSSGGLAERFPSGNYLYHGSTVPKLEKIFQTGALKNGVALVEDDPEASAFDMNSGFEGISWSMDGIDALPGTRGNIAGFLAAPEDVLGGETQLVVPSRPAPYEMLQTSKEVDPRELYTLKNQVETWGDGGFSFGEKNSVDGNLVRMLTYDEANPFLGSSSVYDYEGDISDVEMRKYFSFDEAGKLIWDENLYQKGEVPPALPYMQSLIDRGTFAKNGFEELDSVSKVVAHAKEDRGFLHTLIATERNASKPLRERYGQILESAKAVRIGVDEMYFVTSHKDLDGWLKVMARTGAEPKGILLYDDKQVVLENFASKYEGNQKELSREIGRAVGVNEDFWKNEIELSPETAPRSGHAGHVLLESAVKRDKTVQLDENGKLEVKGL